MNTSLNSSRDKSIIGNSIREQKLRNKENIFYRLLKEKLDELGCPYTEGVDVKWIGELALQAGEPRIRLLQWLLAKFDSKLNDLLDPQFVPFDAKMDSRIQRLLFVCSSLGLCGPNDVDIIRGTARLNKQMDFLEQLVDHVLIRDRALTEMQATGDLGDSYLPAYCEARFVQCCRFVDTIAASGKLPQIFNSRVNLLPPDVMRDIEHQGIAKADNWPVPDLSQLSESAAAASKDFMRQSDIMDELQKKHDLPVYDRETVNRINQRMRLLLSGLSQLMTSFSCCYENELRHWCQLSPPDTSQLATNVRRVHNLLQQFSTLLSSYRTLRTSYHHLTTETKEHLKQIMAKQIGKTACHKVIEDMEKSLEVLEESIMQRR